MDASTNYISVVDVWSCMAITFLDCNYLDCLLIWKSIEPASDIKTDKNITTLTNNYSFDHCPFLLLLNIPIFLPITDSWPITIRPLLDGIILNIRFMFLLFDIEET